MSEMNGYQIKDMIWGATLLGGGGGGACKSGLNALDQYMKEEGIASLNDVTVQVMDVADMNPDVCAACTAAMGAPTKFKEVLISPYINGSFNHLRTMAKRMNLNPIDYSISVEIGGFNTLVPLLVAMKNGIPFIDADGAGRAVPALDTLLLHVSGLPTSPLAMSDDKGNKVGIELEDPMDAPMGEAIGRNICVAFDQMGGLSGWMVKKEEIEKFLPVGSVTKCRNIGKTIREGKVVGVFDRLKAVCGLECRQLASGKILEAHSQQVSGFDKGNVVIEDENGDKWETHFLNENLIVTKNGEVAMTTPDIICYVDWTTGMPLSNADIVDKSGKILVDRVVLGAVKVDEKWWAAGEEKVQKIWDHYFDLLGFPGLKIKRFETI